MIVNVRGTIEETNATYRNGSTITLMEMEFGKIFSNEETFKSLAQSNPDTLQSMKELVEEVPGIKVELNEVVEVRFK
jgi:hypothetical protein